MVKGTVLPTAKGAARDDGGQATDGADGGRREPPPSPVGRTLATDEQAAIESEFNEAFALLVELDLIPEPGMTIRQIVSWIIGQPRNYWSRQLGMVAEYEATHDALDSVAKPCPWDRSSVEVDPDACLRDKLAAFLHNRILR